MNENSPHSHRSTREKVFLRHGGSLLLAGISLICLTFFVPNAVHDQEPGSFLEMATASSWGRLGNMTAAWCSFKIILLSLGLFLVIEATGTILSLAKFRQLALLVYFTHLAPCFGILIGSYYLVKALL